MPESLDKLVNEVVRQNMSREIAGQLDQTSSDRRTFVRDTLLNAAENPANKDLEDIEEELVSKGITDKDRVDFPDVFKMFQSSSNPSLGLTVDETDILINKIIKSGVQQGIIEPGQEMVVREDILNKIRDDLAKELPPGSSTPVDPLIEKMGGEERSADFLDRGVPSDQITQEQNILPDQGVPEQNIPPDQGVPEENIIQAGPVISELAKKENSPGLFSDASGFEKALLVASVIASGLGQGLGGGPGAIPLVQGELKARRESRNRQKAIEAEKKRQEEQLRRFDEQMKRKDFGERITGTLNFFNAQLSRLGELRGEIKKEAAQLEEVIPQKFLQIVSFDDRRFAQALQNVPEQHRQNLVARFNLKKELSNIQDRENSFFDAIKTLSINTREENQKFLDALSAERKRQ